MGGGGTPRLSGRAAACARGVLAARAGPPAGRGARLRGGRTTSMTKARVLVAGWINSPHVLAWAEALLELGYEVHIAGQQVELWPPPEDPDRFASIHYLEPGAVPGIRDRRIGRALTRIARTTRPDLVHAHWTSGYGWMAARAGLRPLVTSAWGSDLLCASSRLELRARRAL